MAAGNVWLKVAKWVFWIGLSYAVILAVGALVVGAVWSSGGGHVSESAAFGVGVIFVVVTLLGVAAMGLGVGFPIIMAVSAAAGATLAVVGAKNWGLRLVYIVGSLICVAASAYGWIFLVARLY